MTAEKLLKDLEQLDVDVAIDGDHLTLDAPRGVLTEDLQRKLRKRKPELI